MALEDELKEINLNQQSELQGVAQELFEDKQDVKTGKSSIDMKTNLDNDEVGLILINDAIFKIIGLEDLSPTGQFKRLASSRQGWKTEAFVRTAQGQSEMRNGGGLMNGFKNMFRRKDQ